MGDGGPRAPGGHRRARRVPAARASRRGGGSCASAICGSPRSSWRCSCPPAARWAGRRAAGPAGGAGAHPGGGGPRGAVPCDTLAAPAPELGDRRRARARGLARARGAGADRGGAGRPGQEPARPRRRPLRARRGGRPEARLPRRRPGLRALPPGRPARRLHARSSSAPPTSTWAARPRATTAASPTCSTSAPAGCAADAPHSSGALDLLSGRAMLEAPVGSRAGVRPGRARRAGPRRSCPAGRSPTATGRGSSAPTPRVGERAAPQRHRLPERGGGLARRSGAPDSTIDWGNSAVSLRYRGDDRRRGRRDHPRARATTTRASRSTAPAARARGRRARGARGSPPTSPALGAGAPPLRRVLRPAHAALPRPLTPRSTRHPLHQHRSVAAKRWAPTPTSRWQAAERLRLRGGPARRLLLARLGDGARAPPLRHLAGDRPRGAHPRRRAATTSTCAPPRTRSCRAARPAPRCAASPPSPSAAPRTSRSRWTRSWARACAWALEGFFKGFDGMPGAGRGRGQLLRPGRLGAAQPGRVDAGGLGTRSPGAGRLRTWHRLHTASPAATC